MDGCSWNSRPTQGIRSRTQLLPCSEPIFLEQPPFSVLTLHQKIKLTQESCNNILQNGQLGFYYRVIDIKPYCKRQFGHQFGPYFSISCPVKYKLHSKAELLTK
jgi:hypothetical protein